MLLETTPITFELHTPDFSETTVMPIAVARCHNLVCLHNEGNIQTALTVAEVRILQLTS